MKNFLNPPEIMQKLAEISQKKSNYSTLKLLILGFFAGVFIALAAHFATVVGQGNYPIGIKKLVMGFVFSTGLMLVLIPGAELWTGNNLMLVGYYSKTTKLANLLKNWLIVYLANFIGSVFTAWLIIKGAGFGNSAIGASLLNTAYAKISSASGLNHNLVLFSKGILCNLLVCLAVMMNISATSVSSKILAIIFPITAFVASGFEHAIANMYFLPAAVFAKSFGIATSLSKLSTESLININFISIFTKNIFMVSFGNLIGGSLFCATLYWLAFGKSSQNKK